MDCSTPGFPVLHCLHSLLKFMSIKSMMVSNHLIFCCPLLLLHSIFPSVRVFSNELALCIRWPKDWSFSFSICPSNVYPGLISFRTDLFDFLKSKGLSRVFSMTTIWKHQLFGTWPSLWTKSYICIWLLENHSYDNTDFCPQSDVFVF